MFKLPLISCITLLVAAPYCMAQLPAEQPEHPLPSLSQPREGAAYNRLLLGTLGPVVVGSVMIGMENDALAVAGLFVMATGLAAGPSWGQYYAGSPWQANIGLAGRTIGVGSLLYGLHLALDDSGCTDDCHWNDGRYFVKGGYAMLIGGLLYGLIDTHFAVHRAAQKSAKEKPFAEGIQLAPILARNAEGDTRVGGQAWMHF